MSAKRIQLRASDCGSVSSRRPRGAHRDRDRWRSCRERRRDVRPARGAAHPQHEQRKREPPATRNARLSSMQSTDLTDKKVSDVRG
jgi:hypothetical protein